MLAPGSACPDQPRPTYLGENKTMLVAVALFLLGPPQGYLIVIPLSDGQPCKALIFINRQGRVPG